MGQATSGLTQYDVDEVCAACNGVFTQYEVEGLYRRFRALDRHRKGYIAADELAGIPELSINPLAKRLIRIFDNVNFKEFAVLLSAFSSRAPKDLRCRFLFQVYDVDGDGRVSQADMMLIMRQLCGSSLNDDQLEYIVEAAFTQANAPSGLTLQDFKRCLDDVELKLSVEIPVSL